MVTSPSSIEVIADNAAQAREIAIEKMSNLTNNEFEYCSVDLLGKYGEFIPPCHRESREIDRLKSRIKDLELEIEALKDALSKARPRTRCGNDMPIYRLSYNVTIEMDVFANTWEDAIKKSEDALNSDYQVKEYNMLEFKALGKEDIERKMADSHSYCCHFWG
jgi:hypothetical protein